MHTTGRSAVAGFLVLLLGLSAAGCGEARGAVGSPEPVATTSDEPAPGSEVPADGGNINFGDSGAGAGDPWEAPVRAPVAPSSDATAQAELNGYLDRCEQGNPQWRSGRVNLPTEITLDLGENHSYVASLDITATPAPAEETVPGNAVESQEVFVKCVVAARLVPAVDGPVSVNPDGELWIPRTFTPSGIVNWAWALSAVAPGRVDVRLELQPAIADDAGTVRAVADGADSTIGTYLTTVEVRAPFLRHLADWWGANWDFLVLVAGAIAAAVTAAVKWGGELGGTIRTAAGTWRGPSSRPARTAGAGDRLDRPDGPPRRRRRARPRSRA